MSRSHPQCSAPESAREGRHPNEGDTLFALLRGAHIFSAVVREVLEVKLLEETSPLPLSLSQFHLLKLMSLNGRHQMSDLAEFLGVTRPAATRNVDKLESLGLVSRSPAEDDRRATLISVSNEGAQLVDRYEELKKSRLGPVLDEFEAEELEQLTQLLDRFATSVMQHGQTEDGACLRCAAYVEPNCTVGQIRGGCPYQLVRQARHKTRGPSEPPVVVQGTSP